MNEADASQRHEGLGGGYSRSKWVAERLVLAARERGLPASVYRFGRISGSTLTSAGNPDDFAARMIKGSIELGCVTRASGTVRLMPVDVLARAVVYLSVSSGAGNTFHLRPSKELAWQDAFEVLRESGYPLAEVPYEDWRQTLIRHAAAHPDHDGLHVPAS